MSTTLRDRPENVHGAGARGQLAVTCESVSAEPVVTLRAAHDDPAAHDSATVRRLATVQEKRRPAAGDAHVSRVRVQEG